MGALSGNSRERMLLDVSVTVTQKDALMTILRALDIEAKEHVFTEDEEDQAFGLAMEEGRKGGIANSKEKSEFETYLFNK